MNPELARKIAGGFAIVAFGILTIGSWLHGATAATAVVRGVEGAVIFGTVAWGLGSMFKEETEAAEETAHDDSQTEDKKAHDLHHAA
jgi:hypothetical protein